MRSIATVLVDRANWARLRVLMGTIESQTTLAQSVIVAGTMVLDRFGRPAQEVEDCGYYVADEVYCELEGSTPGTMAGSLGLAVSEFARVFNRIKPDIVLLIGDRFEALGAGLAAAYTNRTIVHIQGGEVSGSIDESARHCLTKLAQYHVPSTELARRRILAMGETPESILSVGCPGVDLAALIEPRTLADILVCYHPTTTDYGGEGDEIEELVDAVAMLADGLSVAWFWPNIDAGSQHIHKRLRQLRDKRKRLREWKWITHLPVEQHYAAIGGAQLLIGNSSSFVRDSAWFGTPSLIVGNRQSGRESAGNCLTVSCGIEEVVTGGLALLEVGRFPSSQLFGDGFVSQRIVEGLKSIPLIVRKQWHANPAFSP